MKKAPLTVRPARPEDEPAIGALLDRAFDRPRPLEQRRKLWRWRYAENPARTENIPGFLVADRAGDVVGVHGLMPLRMKVGDAQLIAGCSCDLAADPNAGAAGMRLKLAAMSPELSPLHISTSANAAANRITLALGGRETPGGARKLIKPLRLSGLLRRALAPRLGSLAAPLAMVARPVDWILALARRLGPLPPLPETAVETVDRFDSRFDRFWHRFAEDCTVVVLRDAAYLNWRYADYPFDGVQSVALSRDGEILGLAVWHRSVDEDGLMFSALLELMVPAGEGRVAERLLAEVMRRADRTGSHYLIARTCDEFLGRLMLRQGFLSRNLPFSPVTYKINVDGLDAMLAEPGNWYRSLGDGDVCHFLD